MASVLYAIGAGLGGAAGETVLAVDRARGRRTAVRVLAECRAWCGQSGAGSARAVRAIRTGCTMCDVLGVFVLMKSLGRFQSSRQLQ